MAQGNQNNRYTAQGNNDPLYRKRFYASQLRLSLAALVGGVGISYAAMNGYVRDSYKPSLVTDLGVAVAAAGLAGVLYNVKRE
ncbi:MAG: hypothetical protein AABX52_00815 [Nanoarchaeota archaeon]